MAEPKQNISNIASADQPRGESEGQTRAMPDSGAKRIARFQESDSQKLALAGRPYLTGKPSSISRLRLA